MPQMAPTARGKMGHRGAVPYRWIVPPHHRAGKSLLLEEKVARRSRVGCGVAAQRRLPQAVLAEGVVRGINVVQIRRSAEVNAPCTAPPVGGGASTPQLGTRGIRGKWDVVGAVPYEISIFCCAESPKFLHFPGVKFLIFVYFSRKYFGG